MSIQFLPAPDFPKEQFPRLKKKPLAEFIQTLCFTEQQEAGDINFIFCSDKYLLSLNKKYLEHDTLTDVVTFDYSGGLEVGGGKREVNTAAKKLPATSFQPPALHTLNADIFISIDRVGENAKKFSASFSHELHRVMFHGVLHLCGYKDKSPKDIKVMRKKEEYYLSLWGG